MKYLDIPTLTRINSFLDNVDVGDLMVRGNLEAYSCKLAGLDKKLSRSLEEEVMESSSPSELSKSPVGPLVDSSSRKTLIYLILTLNHIYPDYDFTLLRAQHFCKEESLVGIQELVSARLLEAAKVWESTPGLGEEPLTDAVWAGIDEVISLAESDVYRQVWDYRSDLESDPFGEKGSVWSFNYFFYNKKAKRILYFSCRGMSKSAIELSQTTDGARYNTDTEGELEADAATSMANDMDL